MTEYVITSALSLLELLLEEFPIEDSEPHLLVDEAVATLEGSPELLPGLKSDLKLMLDFERLSAGRRGLHHVTSQVREMAYDVGVIIDTFIFTASEELDLIRINNFLIEIESIRRRFGEVKELVLRSGVEDEVGWQKEVSPGEGDYVDNEVVVGLEKDVETVMHDLVLSEKEERLVLMIFGMGGIGKTTLARRIYNHAIIIRGFECRGWASISSEFNHEELLRVLRVLIRQVGGPTDEEEEVMEMLDAESLKEMLRQHVQGKRYIVVLDNVWDDTNVNHILDALPTEDNSSRVLLTCRSLKTVEVNYIFLMEHLSPDSSWQLFLKMVFTSDYKCPKHLEKIGRKIVKKCGNLPLAIKEAGRQLATKTQSESEWEEFLESMDFSETLTVLELSYHKLSQELKSCFVHT